MNNSLTSGAIFIFLHSISFAQSFNLLCNGTMSLFDVNENIIPIQRTIRSEFKYKRTYVFLNGKLDLYPIRECSIDEEKIYCKGAIKDINNPHIDRYRFILINRLSGQISDEDYTLAGFGKENIFEGQCIKATQKF